MDNFIKTSTLPKNNNEMQESTEPSKNITYSRVISNIIKEHARLNAASCKNGKEELLPDRLKIREQDLKDLTKSLGASDALQTMLATQMASIHELQQWFFALTKISNTRPQNQQHYANTVAKLSHVFIQQASLMHKLQGRGQQKVVVEHVHVHGGGQAIVGNVETTRGRGTDE